MSAQDNPRDNLRDNLPAAGQMRSARDGQEPPDPALTPEDVRLAARALGQLDFGSGLTLTQIRRRYRALPGAIFLRLPDSKRYTSTAEVLHDAGLAASRAEGEYLGAHPDLPEAESLDEGGPPAWGPDPIFTVGGVEQSGSGTDTQGLEEGD